MFTTKVALIGARGMLAGMLKATASADYSVTEFDLPEFDLTSRAQVMELVGQGAFDVIINCAAYTNVDGCETDEDQATLVNGLGPQLLAEAALNSGAALLHVSTDYVFAGDKSAPYVERDPVGPQTAYGRSKLAGENAVLRSGLEKFFIIRTSWLFGPGGKNFVETILRLAAERDEIGIVSDQVGSPTFTGDLAMAIFRLLETRDYGLFHFANAGQCSWFEFAGEIVRQAMDHGLLECAPRIKPLTSSEYPLPAKRPAYSVLATDKFSTTTGIQIPVWQDALARYFAVRN
jgi:dTDP-4-dehydrorhamnose reductase